MDLKVAIESVTRGPLIGHGSLGSTHKGRLNESIPVCLKSLYSSLALLSVAKQELKNLARVIHPNLVRFYGTRHSKGDMVLIFEYAEGKTLQKALQERGCGFQLARLLEYGIAVCDACECIYSAPEFVGHGDLRSSKILLQPSPQEPDSSANPPAASASSEATAELFGYGLVRLKRIHAASLTGADPHEITRSLYPVDKKMEEAKDVCAFGILLWEMWLGQPPFPDIPVRDMHGMIDQGKRPVFPLQMPDELCHIISACWLQNLGDRPTFRYIKLALSKWSENNLWISARLATVLSMESDTDLFPVLLSEALYKSKVPAHVIERLLYDEIKPVEFLSLKKDDFVAEFPGITPVQLLKLLRAQKYLLERMKTPASVEWVSYIGPNTTQKSSVVLPPPGATPKCGENMEIDAVSPFKNPASPSSASGLKKSSSMNPEGSVNEMEESSISTESHMLPPVNTPTQAKIVDSISSLEHGTKHHQNEHQPDISTHINHDVDEESRLKNESTTDSNPPTIERPEEEPCLANSSQVLSPTNISIPVETTDVAESKSSNYKYYVLLPEGFQDKSGNRVLSVDSSMALQIEKEWSTHFPSTPAGKSGQETPKDDPKDESASMCKENEELSDSIRQNMEPLSPHGQPIESDGQNSIGEVVIDKNEEPNDLDSSEPSQETEPSPVKDHNMSDGLFEVIFGGGMKGILSDFDVGLKESLRINVNPGPTYFQEEKKPQQTVYVHPTELASLTSQITAYSDLVPLPIHTAEEQTFSKLESIQDLTTEKSRSGASAYNWPPPPNVPVPERVLGKHTTLSVNPIESRTILDETKGANEKEIENANKEMDTATNINDILVPHNSFDSPHQGISTLSTITISSSGDISYDKIDPSPAEDSTNPISHPKASNQDTEAKKAVEGKYREGLRLLHIGKPVDGFQLIKEAAEGECGDAQIKLAHLYVDGIGTTACLETAFFLFAKAANHKVTGRPHMLDWESDLNSLLEPKAKHVSGNASKSDTETAHNTIGSQQPTTGGNSTVSLNSKNPNSVDSLQLGREVALILNRTDIDRTASENFNDAVDACDAGRYIRAQTLYMLSICKEPDFVAPMIGLWVLYSRYPCNVPRPRPQGREVCAELSEKSDFSPEGRKQASLQLIRQRAMGLKATGMDKYLLGFCYYCGRGTRMNEKEAVRWFTKAAEMGNPDAQYSLGVCYEAGEGVARSLVDAARYYRLAATQGHAEAQCNLAICHESGHGAQKDLSSAIYWYHQAAAQRHPSSAGYLASCYEHGRGVSKDAVLAIELYTIQAAGGCPQGFKALHRLGVPLSFT